MSIDFSSKRKSYEKSELMEADLPNLPYPLLERWMLQAVAEYEAEAYSFSLATADKHATPHVRTLLMREINECDDGVSCVFYTNYDSQKGQDLADNPKAEALFFWASLERQIRIAGTVKRVDVQKSKQYYLSRPTDSKVGAWVSRPQSGVIANRQMMEDEFHALSAQFGEDVPYPEYWGGYELVATRIEFWQGRKGRLHDRIVYVLEEGVWHRQRLLP